MGHFLNQTTVLDVIFVQYSSISYKIITHKMQSHKVHVKALVSVKKVLAPN